ncbi:SDR family NAD(P)-dependent oxidoreductase [Saccharopolyspora hirsuta]|uniref:SDR family NAD(P)-dependent oxidoreductase n=1 Tax=Saccharopolyspora hirsuta TaxID=1837 RepID=UPI001FEA64AB|nr:SDR family NAD(P)-dependent oxidoreductase [Saccharopolyspora hirsuta]
MLGCRSADRDAAAAAAIREDVPGAAVAVLEVDVADLSSVRNAVRALDGQPLGALVCNAGVQITRGAQRSHRWVRATFATNHLGHFALIRALLGQLVEPARIALVSSGTHLGPLRSFEVPAPRWEDPRALADPALSSLGGSGRDGPVRYSTSKLANIYTAYELARRGARSADRGQRLRSGADAGDRAGARLPRGDSASPRANRPAAGACGSRHPAGRSSRSRPDLADHRPVVGRVSGGYFAGRELSRSSAECYDETHAQELWEVSDELVS